MREGVLSPLYRQIYESNHSDPLLGPSWTLIPALSLIRVPFIGPALFSSPDPSGPHKLAPLACKRASQNSQQVSAEGVQTLAWTMGNHPSSSLLLWSPSPSACSTGKQVSPGKYFYIVVCCESLVKLQLGRLLPVKQ